MIILKLIAVVLVLILAAPFLFVGFIAGFITCYIITGYKAFYAALDVFHNWIGEDNGKRTCISTKGTR